LDKARFIKRIGKLLSSILIYLIIMSDKTTKKFEEIGQNVREKTILGEFWSFMGQNKKWWMFPILFVILMLGLLIILGGTGAAPFIYTLF